MLPASNKPAALVKDKSTKKPAGFSRAAGPAEVRQRKQSPARRPLHAEVA
jgi:hypothetical protein